MIVVGSRFGIFDPKRKVRTRGWRRVGVIVVCWPAAVLVATVLISLIGLLALPGYVTNYNDRYYIPGDTPSNIGYHASDRHSHLREWSRSC